MKTFTGALNLIFFGAVPLVVASIYLADGDRVQPPDVVLLTSAAIVLGALMVVSGLLAALRLSGARKLKVAPAPTTAERLAAIVLGLVVGVGVAATARVRNVMLVEQNEWHRAVAGDSPQSYERYVRFVEETRPTTVSGPMRLVRLNDTAWLFDMVSDSNAHLVEAALAIDDTSYREAVKAGSVAAVRAYLLKYNPGRHVGEASEALDDASWREAEKAGTAAALRAYRREFARGRHREDAEKALQARYDAAIAAYEKQAGERKADPAATAAMTALLAALREEDVDTDRATVAFAAASGLANGAVERAVKLKKGTVAPVAAGFNKGADAREDAVVEAFNKALEPIVGELFTLEKRPAGETRGELRLYVQHAVRPTGEALLPADQAAVAAKQRALVAGLEVVFTVSAQVPGTSSDKQRFTFTSKPAADLAGSASAIYEGMAAKAFAAFQPALLRGFGLE